MALLLTIVICYKYNYYRTLPIKKNGKILQKSIALMEKVSLNNCEQQILIRSLDTDNDILLFVHGGPGSPDMASIRYYNNSLENQFTVVTWDQRGCGKSISKSIDYTSFSIELFLSDLLQLVNYLRDTYKKDRILLAGHSWGSILGFRFAEKYPHLLKAYIGIGQVANMEEGELFSYHIAKDGVAKSKNAKIKGQMNKINAPVNGIYPMEKDLDQQRDVLLKSGLLLKNNTSYKPMIDAYMKSTEFCFKDMVRLQTASKKSIQALWKEVSQINFIKENQQKIDVPVFFVTGEDDCVTPVSLSKIFFERINSSCKEYFIIENSSHFPFVDNPVAFQSTLLKIKGIIA